PPVERQRARTRARAPAAHLVADREPPVAHVEGDRLRLRDQLDARTRLAPALRLGDRELVELELRLGRLRQLALEPRQVQRTRGVDVGVARARSHDELGRKAVANDDAVALDALGAPDVHFDLTPTDVDEPHRTTVSVVADGNARSHARFLRARSGGFLLGYSDHSRTTIDALCPPKPNEFDIATFRSGRSRAVFGT